MSKGTIKHLAFPELYQLLHILKLKFRNTHQYVLMPLTIFWLKDQSLSESLSFTFHALLNQTHKLKRKLSRELSWIGSKGAFHGMIN